MVLAVFSFAAFGQQPRIDQVVPPFGPIEGGTVVAIRGSHLTGAALTIDRKPVTPLEQSDSQVRLQMPQHDNGYAVIAARTTSGTAYGEFLYLPPPLDTLPPGFITTVAGVGAFTRDYGRATEAMLSPFGLVFDSAGSLYVASPGLGRVHRVVNGTIERIAGYGFDGNPDEPGDGGNALDAFIAFPRGVAVDREGNCYITDVEGRIRRVDRNGIITTVAGSGVRGFSGDGGPASLARINEPSHLVVDDEDIFFIDAGNMRIRRVHRADGTISTFAGTGDAGFSGDGGPAAQAKFDVGEFDRGALALAPNGDVHFVDAANRRIRKIDRRTGIISTVVTLPGGGQGPSGTGGVAFDPAGNLYYSMDGLIVEVDPTGRVLSSFGDGRMGYSEDGTPAADARFGQVQALTIDSSGSIVYSDNSLQTVRRINRATGELETVAGIGPAIIGDDGPATAAVFTGLAGIEFAANGDLLVANPVAFRVRSIDRQGTISTIVGNGTAFGPGEGARPTATGIAAPLTVGQRADGGLDLVFWMWVWELSPDGTLRKVAGRSGGCPPQSLAGDGGPAREATLCQAFDAVRDRDGNLFIADTNNNRIRRVDARSQIITTFAGNGGPVNGMERWNNGTFCGDGGPAFQACINTPFGVAFDLDGNLFVSETMSGRIRKIDAAGTISTFASDVFVTYMRTDAAGNLYGLGAHGLVRLDPAGNVSVLAGGDPLGFSGDGGPARSARVNASIGANGVAIDADGNLLFVDGLNGRIRAVRFGAVLAPEGATLEVTRSSSTLRAAVFDRAGRPAGGVRVDFAAPSSGASCTLSSPFAITDATGVATVTCTPNCIAGTYSVTAQPLTASSSASVSFTNAAGRCRRRTVRRE